MCRKQAKPALHFARWHHSDNRVRDLAANLFFRDHSQSNRLEVGAHSCCTNECCNNCQKLTGIIGEACKAESDRWAVGVFGKDSKPPSHHCTDWAFFYRTSIILHLSSVVRNLQMLWPFCQFMEILPYHRFYFILCPK